MKTSTFIAHLVGLILTSILFAYLIKQPHQGAMSEWALMATVIGAMPIGFAAHLLYQKKRDADDARELLERSERCRAGDRQHVDSLRTALVVKLVEYAGWVHATRQPTNETMKKIRVRLVTLVLEEIERGTPVKVVTDNILPEVIRDIVESKLKSGEFNIKSGPEWQRDLFQFIYTGLTRPNFPEEIPKDE